MHRRSSADEPTLYRIDRKRLYVFPSGQGFMLMFALVLMLLGSINYDIGLGYAMSFTLAALLAVCLLHTWRNLLHLEVLGARARPVFAGEFAHFELIIRNRAGVTRHAVQVSRQSGRSGLFKAIRESSSIHDLKPDGLKIIEIQRQCFLRGETPLGRVLIETWFPLGLVRAWARVDVPDAVLVYPQPVGDAALPLGEGDDSDNVGARREGDQDFTGYRDYRSGDLPRHIDWKVLARSDALVVKRFADGEGLLLHLDWNHVPGADDDEARLSQLCQWVLQAEHHGHAYSLSLPGTNFEADSGEQHQQACLRALALYGIERKTT